MNEFYQLWEKALTYLEEQLPRVAYAGWIKNLHPYKMDGDMFLFEVSSDMHAEIMHEKYEAYIKGALAEAHSDFYGMPPQKIELDFVIPGSATEIPSPAKTEPEEPSERRTLGTPLDPKYTFDTFVVGNSNDFANAAAVAVAEAPGNAYNPLYLYGGVGLGKTHLMQAIGNHIKETYPDKRIVYTNAETFVNELIAMMSNRSNIAARQEFQRKYRDIDVLLMDDIEFITGKERGQEEFFHTFNALYNLHKQIVISSDRPPRAMDKLEDRMRSRFEWGMMVDIKMPDYETRAAILLQKARNKKKTDPNALPLSNDALHYMAAHENMDIRKLEGILETVAGYADYKKDALHLTEITEEIAREALGGYFGDSGERQLTPALIIEAVASYYKIKEEDLRGKTRKREFTLPRHIAMYLIRDLTDASYERIADAFSRDHSSVMHGCEKIKTALKTDADLKRAIADVKGKLRG